MATPRPRTRTRAHTTSAETTRDASTREKLPQPKAPRGQAVVRTVLEVTLSQLAELGFERLTIPHIADMAGVNKTSIYRRWPSKAELVRDALHGAMSHVDDVPDTGELRGDLLLLAQGVAGFAQSPMGKAVVRVLFAEGSNPEVRALASMAYQEVGKRGPWQVLSRALERGELKRGIDPSLPLFTMAGAVVHRVFIERREASPAFIEQVVDLVLLGAMASQCKATAL